MKVCELVIMIQIVLQRNWTSWSNLARLQSWTLDWVHFYNSTDVLILNCSEVHQSIIFLPSNSYPMFSSNPPYGKIQTTPWWHCNMLCSPQVSPPKARSKCTLCQLHGQGLRYRPHSNLLLTRPYSSQHHWLLRHSIKALCDSDTWGSGKSAVW